MARRSSLPNLPSDEPAVLPGRRERAKLEKRTRLVAAARGLFSRKGFAATTTSEIAARADVGTGTLFLYVRSKEELLVLAFLEDMSRVCDRAFATLPPRATLLEEITHVYDAMATFHERDRALGRVYAREMAFVREPNRAGVVAFMERLFTRCDARVEAAKARGELAPDVPARRLSQNLFAAFFLHLQIGLGGDARLTAPEFRAQLHDALALQLRGLAPSIPPSSAPARSSHRAARVAARGRP